MRWLGGVVTRFLGVVHYSGANLAEGVPLGMVVKRCHCEYSECKGWALDMAPEYYTIVNRRWDDPRGRQPRLVNGVWTS